ncbi:hypothetical protein D3C81_737050 [compost metagenome]
MYSEGSRQGGKFDTFTEGTHTFSGEISKQGKFDTFSEGTHTFSGDIADRALDNSRTGDGSLYGYRV